MIRLIDSFHLGNPNIICVALLEASDRSLLMIDCGPESVFTRVVERMTAQNLDPATVKHLVLTHIHLDHAGAAWRWAKEFGARVYVHPLGAPHLVDPSRLLTSAQKIYGDQMEYLWGKLEPIPTEQIIVVDDQTELNFPGLTLKAVYTPGHAQHHNAYWLESEKTVFTGDIAGVTIDQGPMVPPFPPPDIDLETWRRSLNKLRDCQPESIHVTHFGRVDNPLSRFDELEKRLTAWAGWIRDRMREGKTHDQLVPEFQQFIQNELQAAEATEAQCEKYEQANPAFMSVAGLMRYWKKYHPEELR